MINKTIEERLSELEQRVNKLEGAPILTSDKQKKISAREFLIEKDLESEPQKTLALGYYLERVEEMSSFNVNDLMQIFNSAKEKRPKNINDAVNKNIAKGLIMEAMEKKDSKKAWVLTSTGEKHIEDSSKI